MHTQLLSLLLQAGGNPTMSIVMMVGMVAVMYFFMIRPQAKRAKEQKSFSASIGAGEQIITSAGIHGRINKVNEDGTLQIEIARGTFIIIERSAVSMEMTMAYRKKNDAAAVVTTTTN